MDIKLLKQTREYTLKVNNNNTEYYVKLSRDPKSNELQTCKIVSANSDEPINKSIEDSIIDQIEKDWEQLL
jgi:hypothetical protein